MDIDFLRFSLFICENVVPRILALRDQRNLRPYLLLELGRVDILVRQLEILGLTHFHCKNHVLFPTAYA